MPEEKKKSQDENFDIFAVYQTYPDAAKIFTARLKSLQDIKNNCVIVLDTNSLLVPYNTGKDSLEQIKRTYESLSARKQLIVPGQVAREFARNRANKLVELFQQLNRRANTRLQIGKYPLLESLEDYQNALRQEEEINSALNEYRKTVSKVLDHIKAWTWNDPVSVMYGELFNESVVLDPPVDQDTVKAQLSWRFAHGIPPGYKDAAKDDGGIGDYLIWQTILEVGKSMKKSVVFVSGEEKPDWWHKSEGQTLYPRYELFDEFRRHSEGQSFHIIQFSRLLDLYGASEEVVAEVRQKEQELRFEVPSIRRQISRDADRRGSRDAEDAVYEWLLNKYPKRHILQAPPDIPLPNRPDFVIAEDGSAPTAVEVIYTAPMGNIVAAHQRIRDRALSGYYGIQEGIISEFIVAVVSDIPDNLLNLAERLERSPRRIGKISYYFFHFLPDGRLEEVYSY